MAEASEPGQLAAASGGSSGAEEDEEREPLLPRIAWAPPRKGAPGSAVRLAEAPREEGAASAGDTEQPLRPGDAPRCPSRGVGLPQSSPADLDWNRAVGSGATRLSPSPRALPRAPAAPAAARPPHSGFSLSPRSGLPPCPCSVSCLALALQQRQCARIPSGAQAGGQPPVKLTHLYTLPFSPVPAFTLTLSRGSRLLHPSLNLEASSKNEPKLLESDTEENLTL